MMQATPLDSRVMRAGDDRMDQTEIQARATIAAALIMSHAVEIPAIPKTGGSAVNDQGAIRLRQLTDYVYTAITAPKP
jgi:hypothetical protein